MTSSLSRLLLASVITGVVVGLAVAGFEMVSTEVLLKHLFQRPLWQQALAPGVGLVITAGLLRWAAQGATAATSDEYIREFHAPNPRLPITQLPGKLAAGAVTIGFGGALGLEGPSVYTGSTLGLGVSDALRRWLSHDDARLLLSAGAAAGIAAVFQTPATGVIFALEAPYRDDVARRALLPALLAAAASYLTFVTVLQPDDAIPALGFRPAPIDLNDLAGAALLGIAAGLSGRGFATLVKFVKNLTGAVAWWRRVAGAAVIMAALAVLSDHLYGEPLSLGPGINAIAWATQPDRGLMVIAVLFAIRMVATLATLGGGGSGGLFIPLVVQGTILGRFVGGILPGSEAISSLWPTLGLAAFLGAGYRAPIAAVMFVAESTSGDSYVVPALIAAAVSQLVAGPASVAVGQRSARIGHLESRLKLPVATALSTDQLTVPSDATLAEFVEFHVIGRRRKTVPVVDGDTYLGMCTLADLSETDQNEWSHTRVAEVMRRETPVGHPGWNLRQAVAAMEAEQIDVLAIVDRSGVFIGVVEYEEIIRLDEILDEAELHADENQ